MPTPAELRLERSEQNQFASRVEFEVWADQVRALITDNIERHKFIHYVGNVQTAYAMGVDPVNAINDAIGLANELEMRQVLEAKKLVEQTTDVRESDSSNDTPKSVIQQAIVPIKKFAATTAQKILSGLIVGLVLLYLSSYFGFKLR